MIKFIDTKILLKACILLFIFVVFYQDVNPGIASGSAKCLFDLNKKSWQVLGDSGWPGNSSGSVENLKENNHAVRFNYTLKATKLWPWPEIDFFVNLDRASDLAKFTGIQLYIKGIKKEEIYFYFLVEDKNLGIPKPSMYRFLLTDKTQKIYLPFSEFKIARDWMPRHPGFNPSIEWDKVKGFGFHKKGIDGEVGNIYLFAMKILQKKGPNPVNLERLRSGPIRYYLINLRNYSFKKNKNKITIYNYTSLKECNTLNPYLYGANWGVWLDFPEEKKVVSIGLKILRAGGPFMDRYNWRNAKYTFPGNKKAVLMASLDRFIEYCRRIGAEPLIQINALGYAPGEKNEDNFIKCMDEKSAADLVYYLNREKGYNIKFFEIGNEPLIWHNVHFDVRNSPCSLEEYFEIFKKIAVAIKEAQAKINPDLKIKIFAPAIPTAYLNWKTLSLKDKNLPIVENFLKKCHEFQNNRIDNPEGFRILDVLSFHLFPSFVNFQTVGRQNDISLILKSTQTWWNNNYINRYDSSLPFYSTPEVLPKFKRLINNNYPGTELAITEFNIESESMVEYDPLIKVLYLADLYGIMAKHGVDYCMQFCLNSSDNNIALLDDLDNITPLYYPLSLYAKYFKGIVLDTDTSLPEKINVYACNNDGEITIMAINKEKKDYLTQIIVDSGNENTIHFFHKFPSFSLTCIRLKKDKENILAECWEYGER